MTRQATLEELFPDHVSGFWGQEAGTLEHDVRIIRNGDVQSDGSVRWDQLPIRAVSPKELAKSSVHAGDLLLTTSGNCARVAFVDRDDGDVCASNFTRRLRADPALADPRYLFHLMRGDRFRGLCAPYIRGTTLENLSVKDAFAAVRLPLPPIEEQRRIASILDAADALRAKRRQALETLDSLTQSIFIEMFVDDVEAAWPQAAIEDLAATTPGSIRTGPFGSQLLHEEFVEDGPVAVLGIDNVVANDFRWGQRRFISEQKYEVLKRYTVHPGDVLVTIMGTTGRIAVVPDDVPCAINTKHLCCVTLDQGVCLPWFLWGCLRYHPGVLRQLGATRGAVMPGLNMGLIKGAVIPVPPLATQQEFVDRIADARGLQFSAANQAVEIERLFTSLQHRAFRGEL